jgi:hypothetical protein
MIKNSQTGWYHGVEYRVLNPFEVLIPYMYGFDFRSV